MGLRNLSRKIWSLAILLFILKITLASSLPRCTECEDCSPHPRNSSRSSYYEINRLLRYDVVICKNVKEDSVLHSHVSPGTWRIIFEDSNIKSLTGKFLGDLFNINEIFFNGTGIEDMRAGAFVTLYNLEKLYLHENKLTIVKEGRFNSLFAMEVLDLHSNQISSIANKSFYGIHNLKNLNLADNKLSNLSSGVFLDLYNLQALNLSKNAFTNLDIKFLENKLSIFDFSYNKIRELPEKLFSNLTHLVSLNISKNDISNLNISQFSHSKVLNTLSMHSLRLKNLNIEDYGLLTDLKELDIQFNNFKIFNDDIIDFCPHLISIDIDGNKISCAAVYMMLLTSMQRNITMKYTPNYQNENVEGIKCSKNVENIISSENISNILFAEIPIVSDQLLGNVSDANKPNGKINNLGDKAENTKTNFSEFLETIKQIQNFTLIETSLRNISSILMQLRSPEPKVCSRIEDKIERIEENIHIEKLLMNISHKLEENNMLLNHLSDDFRENMKRIEVHTPGVEVMTNILDKLNRLEVLYEKFYDKFSGRTENSENGTVKPIP